MCSSASQSSFFPTVSFCAHPGHLPCQAANTILSASQPKKSCRGALDPASLSLPALSGVRYNAEKKKVGNYYTTPIYR